MLLSTPQEHQSHPPPTIQPSTAVTSTTARLLQLPVVAIDHIYPFVPWYERLLHVSHVHRQLPSVWLVWSENDHVRLSSALLESLELLRPSAVHCSRHVQSLSFQRNIATSSTDTNPLCEWEYLPPAAMQQHTKPAALSRLEICLQRLRELSVQSPQSATPPPFSRLRTLIAPQDMFHCLLECSDLPHLHSLSLHQFHRAAVSQLTAREKLLTTQLISLPALRRVRVDELSVDYTDLLALPHIEHIDIQRVQMARGRKGPVDVAMSAALRRLLLGYTHVLNNNRLLAGDLLPSLAPTSLQHLKLSARLTDDDIGTLTALHSLTALDLCSCDFMGTTGLTRLMSDSAEPLLPNLQRFAIDDTETTGSDNSDKITPAVAFLHSYSRQLRHVKLSVKLDPAKSFGAVLSVVVSSMSQLESLELAAVYNNFGEEVGAVALSNDADMAHPPQPALPALRSLTLRGLPMTDAAVEQLLACSPQLLELTIDRIEPLTPAVWSSLRHCRQLLALYVCPASELVTEAAFALTMQPSSSSTSRPPTVTFPSLTYLAFTFFHISVVDSGGFVQLLGLFDGSPIQSFDLQLPDNVASNRFIGQLPPLPHLTSFRLDADLHAREEAEQLPVADNVRRAMQKSSERPMQLSCEQHSVNMRYYWQDGVMGELESELRAKYAAGVQTPLSG